MAVALAGCSASGTGAAPRVTPSPAPQVAAPAPSPPKKVGLVTFPAASPLRVTIIGDSIGARGSFASTRDKTWHALVLRRLERYGEVVRYGTYVSRRTATGLTIVHGITDVHARATDLVFVGLGANDYHIGTPVADFQREYGRLLGDVRAQAAKATLVCLGMWEPSAALQRAYDMAIRSACTAKGGHVVALADLYAVPANRLPAGVPAFGGYHTDGFHPNDRGQAAMAARVVRLLRI